MSTCSLARLRAGLIVTLVPVLNLSRLHVLEEHLVVAETSGDTTRDGGDDIDKEVLEVEERDGSTDRTGRVHRAAREGALSENSRNNRESDAQRGSILSSAGLVDRSGEDDVHEHECASELKEENLDRVGSREGASGDEGRLQVRWRQGEAKEGSAGAGTQELSRHVAQEPLLAQPARHEEGSGHSRVEVAARDPRGRIDQNCQEQTIAESSSGQTGAHGVGIATAAEEGEQEDTEELGKHTADGNGLKRLDRKSVV